MASISSAQRGGLRPFERYWEFARFVLSGIISAACNLAVLWAVRHVASYAVALFAGVIAGMSSSFVLTKIFAFRSRSWDLASREGVRFIVVYAAGLVAYWTVALMLVRYAAPPTMPRAVAELLSAVVASLAMMVVTYLGHRHFTYRGATR
jgi:putative flippase GtrA